MKKTLLVLSLFVSIITVSCQKELSDPSVTPASNGGGSNGGGGSTNGASIVGNWKFVSTQATTESTVQLSAGGITVKTVTTSDYTSTNNAGTVTITSNTMSLNNVSYDIAGIAHATTYQNGVSIGTIDQPFSQSFPPTSSTSNYTQVNADSIYIPAQGSNIASGYRLALNGNILKMTTSVVQDNTVSAGGVPAQQHAVASSVTTLQKQ